MLYAFKKRQHIAIWISSLFVSQQIVYMKDGHILHQGTLQEIRDENPELVADWRATDNERNECESEGTDVEDVTKEPAKMMHQISGKMEEKKLKGKVIVWFFVNDKGWILSTVHPERYQKNHLWHFQL